MSRRRFACGANYPVRLFQNVGVFRLFSRKNLALRMPRKKGCPPAQLAEVVGLTLTIGHQKSCFNQPVYHCAPPETRN
jgi:hypothetical protein